MQIGGLDAQIQEIKEAVELPLTHPELYEDLVSSLLRVLSFIGKLGLERHCLPR
jgi:SpoVK/Ycf46/Vps4 family AAA+-type ATPase